MKRASKPWSEKTTAERLAEAYASLRRTEETYNTGNNRYGAYGDSCRDSIRRWKETIAKLESEKS
jgi:hypothetical protein